MTESYTKGSEQESKEMVEMNSVDHMPRMSSICQGNLKILSGKIPQKDLRANDTVQL